MRQHPSLGIQPVDFAAAFPAAAERLRANGNAIAARALETAIDRDPKLRDRNDDLALRQLLHDATVYLDRIALCVASGSIDYAADWAEMVVPLYRRRKVPMDDLLAISEGLRLAVRAYLGPDEMALADRAIDAAVTKIRWNRRLAGDARKRNRLLQLLYKGA